MKIVAMRGFLALGMTGLCWAQSSSSGSMEAGNLPSGFYVRPSCVKPDKSVIGKQPVSTDREEVLPIIPGSGASTRRARPSMTASRHMRKSPISTSSEF